MEKTFFQKTLNIREALFLLMKRVETEKEFKLLEDAIMELSALCPNPHISTGLKSPLESE